MPVLDNQSKIIRWIMLSISISLTPVCFRIYDVDLILMIPVWFSIILSWGIGWMDSRTSFKDKEKEIVNMERFIRKWLDHNPRDLH